MIIASALETIFAYNTLVVLAGTMLLGIAAGITGTFLLLRGRALAGDVIGHSALPGVALAFLIYSTIFPGEQESSRDVVGWNDCERIGNVIGDVASTGGTTS